MAQVNFKVSCRCTTYNQASYIRDTFRGFCEQETNFPYVCVVIDDASTDGEQELIKQYLTDNFEIDNQDSQRYDETEDYLFYHAQHKTNKNCFFTVYLLKYNHYQIKKSKFSYMKGWIKQTKYSASCEGDDYWIDNMKLQRQADYLDTYPSCSAVFSNIILRNEKNNPPTESKQYYDKEIYTLKDFYRGVVFPVNSLCLRSDIWLKTKSLILKANGDFKLAYASAVNGYIYRMDDFFSVYRKTGKGLSSQWDSRTQFIHDINEWFVLYKQLNFPDKTSHAHFQSRLICDYLFDYGCKGFPYKDIKDCFFKSRWYIYVLDCVAYPYLRFGRAFWRRLHKNHGKG